VAVLARVLITAASVLVVLPAGAQAGTPTAGCDAYANAETDLPSLMRQKSAGSTFCVGPFAFVVDETLPTQDGDVIRKQSNVRPVLSSTGVPVFDGAGKNVLVQGLVIDGGDATRPITAGAGWRIDQVDVDGAGGGTDAFAGAGIGVLSTNVTITNSRIHDNARYGLIGVAADGLRVQATEFDHNNNECYDVASDGENAGPIKVTRTDGVTFVGNDVHDNWGNGIWVDISSSDATISNNSVEDNVTQKNGKVCGGGDGIRVEISCNSAVTGNVVTGNAHEGIEIANSYGVDVIGNTVSLPTGASIGIRVLSDRVGSYESDCGSGSYKATDVSVSSNTVTTVASTQFSGVTRYGGGSVNGSGFTGNTYHVPSCTASAWKWYESGATEDLDWSEWNDVGQDVDGSCD
jgi:parallel beta-helix repeat protein